MAREHVRAIRLIQIESYRECTNEPTDKYLIE